MDPSTTATASAFVQQREKILPEAIDTLCGNIESIPFTSAVRKGTLYVQPQGKLIREIVSDSGTALTGHPGAVLYIPKNTHIHFGTCDQARYVYFVFPANWQKV